MGNEGRNYSIGAKLNDNFQEKESRNKPGPSSYDTSDKADAFMKSMPSFKIGTSKRTDSVPKERLFIPNPTSYDPKDSYTKQKSAAFGFGTSNRKSIENPNAGSIPGPGEYKIESHA